MTSLAQVFTQSCQQCEMPNLSQRDEGPFCLHSPSLLTSQFCNMTQGNKIFLTNTHLLNNLQQTMVCQFHNLPIIFPVFLYFTLLPGNLSVGGHNRSLLHGVSYLMYKLKKKSYLTLGFPPYCRNNLVTSPAKSSDSFPIARWKGEIPRFGRITFGLAPLFCRIACKWL